MELTQQQRDELNATIREMVAPGQPIENVRLIGEMFNDNPGLYEAMHVADPETGVTIMNPGPDAGAAVEKMLRKVSQAAPDYVRGMQNPKDSFKAAAVRSKDKWAVRVQDAIANDRFGRAMNGVDEAAAIRTATADNGAAYTAGVAKRKDKITTAFNKLIPAIGAAQQRVRQMPNATDADNEQRAVEMIRAMRQLKGITRGV